MEILVHTRLTPRIIEVLSPAVSVTVQEIVNAVRDWEDDNLSFDQLISAAGKEALGGGIAVGITATLQNAQLMFSGRAIPLESAKTCTTADPTGKVLNSTAGLFQTNGVYRGCTVANYTSGSIAAVISVDSEIKLTSFQVTGGSRNTWLVGDVYRIYENTQCSITGGNLVAVDSAGAELSPVMQSPHVQVVRSSSSSATLQELSAIQYSSFGGCVTVDVINGTAGTDYNIGTIENPVGNLADAITIAKTRGFDTLFIKGDITLSGTINLEGYIIRGESIIKSKITIEASSLVTGTEFLDATITGTLDGDNSVEHCAIQALNYVQGHMHDCLLEEGYTITLGGSDETVLLNCWSSGASQSVAPIIDLGGSGRSLTLRGYSGEIKFVNKSGSENAALDFESGKVILDRTITAGNIVIRGTGQVEDNSTGTTTVDIAGVVSRETVADAVWAKDLSVYSLGEAGHNIQSLMFGKEVVLDAVAGVAGTDFPTGTRARPVDNLADALTICATRGLIRIMTRTSITVQSGQSIDGIVIATHGILDTDIVFESGCSAHKATIRYANISGTITAGDLLFIESCSVGNLDNFTGIMNLATFGQGCEIELGAWANFIDCHCGGEPTNEPEISIGAGSLNVVGYQGNLKLTNKTGSNRAVANFASGNVSIASSCVAGKIQILGIGEVEKDESGDGCHVDVDAVITNSYIADHVLMNTFNKAELTKISDTEYTEKIYESDGITLKQELSITKAGDVETRVPV